MARCAVEPQQTDLPEVILTAIFHLGDLDSQLSTLLVDLLFDLFDSLGFPIVVPPDAFVFSSQQCNLASRYSFEIRQANDPPALGLWSSCQGFREG